jgi:transcription elongation factor GreA
MPIQTATNTVDDPPAAAPTRLAAAAASGRPIIAAGHQRALRAESDRLRRKLEVEFAERLRDARSFGSPDANDDYLQIKEEEAVLAAGIVHISMLLETAVIVDEAKLEAGVAALGSTVEVRDRDSGHRQKYRLIGGHELASLGVASAGSPMGQALMGRSAGDLVDVALPRSRQRQLEIVAVEAGEAWSKPAS